MACLKVHCNYCAFLGQSSAQARSYSGVYLPLYFSKVYQLLHLELIEILYFSKVYQLLLSSASGTHRGALIPPVVNFDDAFI